MTAQALFKQYAEVLAQASGSSGIRLQYCSLAAHLQSRDGLTSHHRLGACAKLRLEEFRTHLASLAAWYVFSGTPESTTGSARLPYGSVAKYGMCLTLGRTALKIIMAVRCIACADMGHQVARQSKHMCQVQ